MGSEIQQLQAELDKVQDLIDRSSHPSDLIARRDRLAEQINRIDRDAGSKSGGGQ
jgi:hypothetical protein